MPLITCSEILLTSLQNVFSTTVGVSFAYPILSQIIDLKNEKTLKECDRVLRLLGNTKEQGDVIRLGGEKNQFQFRSNVISRLTENLTIFSAGVGVLSFSMLVTSSLTSICISHVTALFVCSLLSSPFALAVYQLLRWYDSHSRLRGAISFYRGDHKWKKEI